MHRQFGWQCRGPGESGSTASCAVHPRTANVSALCVTNQQVSGRCQQDSGRTCGCIKRANINPEPSSTPTPLTPGGSAAVLDLFFMDSKHKMIAVVDDDAGVRQSLERLLNLVGYTVRTFATSGEFFDCDREGPCALRRGRRQSRRELGPGSCRPSPGCPAERFRSYSSVERWKTASGHAPTPQAALRCSASRSSRSSCSTQFFARPRIHCPSPEVGSRELSTRVAGARLNGTMVLRPLHARNCASSSRVSSMCCAVS